VDDRMSIRQIVVAVLHGLRDIARGIGNPAPGT
jgi:hypothetical protein